MTDQVAPEGGEVVEVSWAELAALLKRAADEEWRQLVLVGDRSFGFPFDRGRVYRLTQHFPGLGGMLSGLRKLTSLTLSNIHIGEDGARAIADSLTELTLLDLSGNSIGDEGARAIAGSVAELTSLYLPRNDIGDEGARAVANSLTGLTSLNLWGNSIGDEGAQAIADWLTRLTWLDLSHNGIGDKGARAIADSLTGLTWLDLSNNDIGNEGARAIARALTGLKSLNLSNNDMGNEGARAIAGSLTGLTWLNLSSNDIGNEGARAIAGSLTGLKSLNLSSNGIGDEGARAIAGSLRGLTSLRVASNGIGDEGARAITDTLTGLTWLDLSQNRIGDEGARAIAGSRNGFTWLNLSDNSIGVAGVGAILEALSSLPKLAIRRIRLGNNQDEVSRLLPKEILEETRAEAVIAAYRRYKIGKAAGTLQRLNEVKLLVVGNEAVGKTSLLRFLIEGKARDPGEERTPGIAHHENIAVNPWTPAACAVRLNVWDFGGQEMMRGTHRFFLTERSIYLLVLEDRREDDRSVFDWLKTIRNRGAESPILVVINKSDEGKQDLRLDESGLAAAYPAIAGFLRTSCDQGAWAAESIGALREAIVRVITTDERLKHVRDPIPAPWLRIKGALSRMARERAVLTQVEFAALCAQADAESEAIVDAAEQRAVLQLLHQLGTVVAHGLERKANAAQRELSLLEPNWLTQAIYTVLDRARGAEQEGEFDRAQLSEWLDPARYPAERHEFILGMMQDDDVGLCFRLPGPSGARYLVPEALPKNTPYLGQRPTEALRFRFDYEFLPPGLIPRLIVEAHANVVAGRPRWRGGVMLVVRDCEVLVTANLDRRRIDLVATGPSAQRRGALNVVVNDLEAVHALNPEAKPTATVPLPDEPERAVGYAHLERMEQEFGPEHAHWPDGAARQYTVGELLDGVRRDGVGGARKRAETHLVVLIHGIRTRALWEGPIRKELVSAQQAGLKVEMTNYGRFGLFRFLFPLEYFRRRAADEVADQIKDALRLAKAERCSIIAHSFGTYLVASILERNPELMFRRVIFCGSVVRYQFPFAKHNARFEQELINEVGSRDVWPVIAEAVTFGYGSAGAYGFNRPGVRNRWHNGKAHGDFLTAEFCRRFWVPLLRDGTCVEDDSEREAPAWWLDSLRWFKWLVSGAIALAAWGYFGR